MKLLTKKFLKQSAAITTNWTEVFSKGRITQMEAGTISGNGERCIVGCFYDYDSSYWRNCRMCSHLSSEFGRIFEHLYAGATAPQIDLELCMEEGLKDRLKTAMEEMHEHAKAKHPELVADHIRRSKEAGLL